MKPILSRTIVCLLATSLLFISCKKDDPEPEEPVNTTPPVFNWKVNNTTTYSSDSTYCYPGFTDIYAYKNGTVNSVYIQLSTFSAGNYTISSGNGTSMNLVVAGKTYTPSAAQVTITSSTSDKLSGKVNASFTGTTVTSMTAEFTDIPKR